MAKQKKKEKEESTSKGVLVKNFLAACFLVAFGRSLSVFELNEQSFAIATGAGSQQDDTRPSVVKSALRGNDDDAVEVEPAKTLEPFVYVPADTEKYFMDFADKPPLNFATLKTQVCPIWRNETGPKHIHEQLHAYLPELEDFNQRLSNFKPQFPDLRQAIRDRSKHNMTKDQVCQTVRLHPDGHGAIFKSGHLSSSPSGAIEPLLSPLRHPNFCLHGRPFLMNLKYLVHDFEAICKTIKPTSRTVLIDMGASLKFHHKPNEKLDSPALYLLNIFQTFGISFDHIYAFEMKRTEAAEVFELVPKALLPAYHWINVGVSADPKHKLNPWQMLLDTYTEDDLVIVKLDIDTPSIEMPLTKQLLEDERLHKIVDHFYFEHHVSLGELLRDWGNGVRGSVKDSFDLFYSLREKGIAAHSWV